MVEEREQQAWRANAVRRGTRQPAARQAQALEVIARLRDDYPDAGIVLDFGNNWELLVAVILSAQCTDKMVNQVTTSLFKKYRTIEDYASADPVDLRGRYQAHRLLPQQDQAHHRLGSEDTVRLRRGGPFQHGRTAHAARCGSQDRQRRPRQRLPGVVFASDPDAGIAVDTHVNRLSQRLGLAASNDSDKIERELMEIVPRDDWFRLTYLLIEHGRAVCTAKRPRCGECLLQDICPSAFKA